MTTQNTNKLSWTRDDDGNYVSGPYTISRVNTKHFHLVEIWGGERGEETTHFKGRLKECQAFAQEHLENKTLEGKQTENPIVASPVPFVGATTVGTPVLASDRCTCSDPDFYTEPCDSCITAYYEDMRFGRDIPVHDFVAEPRASTTLTHHTTKGTTRAYRKALRKDKIYMPLQGTFHVIDMRGRVLAPEDVSLETFNLIVAGAAKVFGQAI